MLKPKLFQELTNEEKADFFAKCQEILIAHHPDSQYLVRPHDLKTKQAHFLNLVKNYKGYAFFNNDICVLYNKIKVSDPKDIVWVLKKSIMAAPAEDYNAAIIDFVAFRQLRNAVTIYKLGMEEKFFYFLYVKNNEVKLYESSKMIGQLRDFKIL